MRASVDSKTLQLVLFGALNSNVYAFEDRDQYVMNKHSFLVEFSTSTIYIQWLLKYYQSSVNFMHWITGLWAQKYAVRGIFGTLWWILVTSSTCRHFWYLSRYRTERCFCENNGTAWFEECIHILPLNHYAHFNYIQSAVYDEWKILPSMRRPRKSY